MACVGNMRKKDDILFGVKHLVCTQTMSEDNLVSTIDPHVDRSLWLLGIEKKLNVYGEFFKLKPHPDPPVLIHSKDIPINQVNNSWASLYLPLLQ